MVLHRCRRRNDPPLVQRVLADLHTSALRQPAAVEAAYAVSAQTMIAIVVAMQTAVEQLE